MERQRAINLLNETFNSDFDVKKFAVFVKELFNNFNVNVKSWSVWKEYLDYIESYQLLGSYTQNKEVIDVLVVKLKKSSSRDRARTMQRNFIAKYLGNAQKDAALVAFYGDDPEDWRFSFVKMEYNLVKDKYGKVKPVKELTPAKRYSFLVGVNEPNHTCRRQFLKLIIEEDINPSLSEIEQAFSIDNVTKEFFEKYKELFLELKESLEKAIKEDKNVQKEFEKKNISTVDFAKKLLGQIVFIYFLQKKGWLGVEKGKKWDEGPRDFIKQLFNKKIIFYNNFFNDVLEPLFYDALNNPREGDDGYHTLFKRKIPFLNGGLFEPINDYDWIGTEIKLDNSIFDNILSTFDRFNFTVKEDEPLEKEVAVDPEMLGKVFENLLEIKDRKSKGAFYTPREIVHYMCQQSLINYLETNILISRKDIEKFIQLGDLALDMIIKEQEQVKKYGKSYGIKEEFSLPKSIKENYKEIDKLLKEIKIVDPAVGSGAFPVGMMNEIVKARSILSIYYNEKRSDYDLKREIIENCLYGVDIESSAVDITKLRFWLSLIVDELDMQNIKPLPNLDHKIMCGNSLLEEFEGVKLFDEKLLGEVKKDVSFEVKAIEKEIAELYKKKGDIVRGKTNGSSIKEVEKEIKKLERKKDKLLSAPKDTSRDMTLDEATQHRIKESQKKLSELKSLQKQFFNEQNRKIKKQLREQIDKIEWELIEETLKEQGNEDAMEKLAQYKKNKAKPFFLWKLYFAEVFQRENPGFDVVIGNPPYVRQEMFKDIKDSLRLEYLSFFNGRADIYTYFYRKGFMLLKQHGVLAFISSNKFFVRGYGKNTRNYLTNEVSLLEVINFGELPVFKAAVDSAIVIVKNKEPSDSDKMKAVQVKKASEIADLINTLKRKGIMMKLSVLSSDEWVFDSPEKIDLLNKLRKGKTTLSEYYDNNIFAGIKTGLDSAFVISKEIRDKLIKEDPKSREVIKPWLRGKDVRKWKAHFIDLYVIYIPLNKVSIDDYPSVKSYLTQFKSKLESRATSQRWFEMQQPQERFTELFNSPKIIYPDCAKEMRACFDTNHSYGTMAMYFIPYDSLILGILNSKLFDWYARMTFATFGDPWKGGRIIFKTMYMREVPIQTKNEKIAKQISELVDQILSITKSDDYLDNPDKKAKVKRLEKEIDNLVYKLYELVPEEIKIVEEFNNAN